MQDPFFQKALVVFLFLGIVFYSTRLMLWHSLLNVRQRKDPGLRSTMFATMTGLLCLSGVLVLLAFYQEFDAALVLGIMGVVLALVMHLKIRRAITRVEGTFRSTRHAD